MTQALDNSPLSEIGDTGAGPHFHQAHSHHEHHSLSHELQNAALILGGVLISGMGLKGFLEATHFIDGGVTGISMLMAKVAAFPLAVWLVVLNIPFIALGYKMVGRGFAIRSTLAIFGLSAAVAVIPFPAITTDKLLTAVFGGLCIGAGVGMAIRGGAVLDGTEVAALVISRSTSLLNVGDVILGINVLIFAAAGLLLGGEPAMYSLLTYVSASKAVDFLLHGLEEYTAIIIMSPKSDDIRKALTHDRGRGVTVYTGRGGRSGREQEILHCVVTRLEIGCVKETVHEIDPGAFIIMHPLSEVDGGVLRKRRKH